MASVRDKKARSVPVVEGEEGKLRKRAGGTGEGAGLKEEEVSETFRETRDGILMKGVVFALDVKATTITTQSNILAIPVILGMHRQGIVRGLMAARSGDATGDGSWLGYILCVFTLSQVHSSTKGHCN